MKKRKYIPRFTIATIQEIRDSVNDYFGVDISLNTRKKEVSAARMVYFMLAIKLTTNPLRIIADLVNRKHCTVLYAQDKFYNNKAEPIYMTGYNELLGRFKSDTEGALLNMKFEEFLKFKHEAKLLLKESNYLNKSLNEEYEKIKSLNGGDNPTYSKLTIIASKLDEPTLKKLLETRIEPFILMNNKNKELKF